MEIYMAEGKKLEETILATLTPCLDFWHHAYQNNYCNNVYGTLLHRKVRACGKIVTNRGLPVSVKEDIQRIKNSSKSFYCKEDVMLLVSKDKQGKKGIKNYVIFDATMLKSEATYMVRGNQLMKHECTLEYNKYKPAWVE
jgi:hypothetical protein